MTEVGDIPDLLERLKFWPYRTIYGDSISGRDNLLNRYENERDEAAQAIKGLLAEVGRLKKERDYAVRWANRSVDSVKEECFAEVGRLRAVLTDARLFVGSVAGENQPAREWAVALRDRIDAALSHPEDKL